ncbi:MULTISPECIES: DUF5134 domain-containing protein [Microcella]|uniref:DUF5134 domain-containing protein n=1 Tax=Microcella TaxID=337004 RepID=UPI0015CF14A3|nr:DUF5134 domain-containing protein [Microcella indica]
MPELYIVWQSSSCSTTQSRDKLGRGFDVVEGLAAQWGITIALAAAGSYALFRLVLSRRGFTRIEMLLHMAMSSGMIAMTWPWGMSLAPWPQILLFALAALWFAGLGVAEQAGWLRRGLLEHSAALQYLHAVMMATMCWMLIAMSDGGAMAEGSMSGMQGEVHGSLPLAVTWLGVGTIVALVAGVAKILAGLIGSIRRGRVREPLLYGDHVSSIVMGLGMVVMSIAIVVP